MVSITRVRQHTLDPVVARARVEQIASKLADRFGARCRWDGDRLCVDHTSVQGALSLTAHQVTLEAELRFPVSLLRTQIETEIDRLMERELSA